MPTISVNREDFAALVGQQRSRITADQLQNWLMWVKGELKDDDGDPAEWRVELQDSNRPDLWCTEGIARQIRTKLTGTAPSYPFFPGSSQVGRRIVVSAGMDTVRPYVAACCARGYRMTAAGLAQFIQTQEKLADIYGRKRSTVSIGLYRLSRIVFPVSYTLVTPDAGRFTPLGFDDPLSLREILSVHPKGLEYGGILAGHERLPLLIDAEGHVLSFPPIINSRDIGEVRVGDDALFVEVTGTDFAMVGLTLNILAVNFADRGAEIDAVDIQYPYTTPGGPSVRTPSDPSKPRSIAVPEIAAALGLPMGPTEVGEALKTYGYGVSGTGQTLEATLPPYRQDVMHAVDVIEDVAISRGYQSFEPLMPSLFTVGGLSRIEQASDRVRDLMIGFGFQEIISNIMASRADLIERMRLDGTPWERLVEVDNVMSQSYACLRPSIVPSLLRVEAASGRAFYPHRLFEAGEIVLPDAADPHGSRTDVWVAALLAHAEANFSDIHSYLDLLLYYLDVPYRLEALDHPSFLAGRAGRVLCDGRLLGLIGELHPEVLEQWQIGMPVSVFEVSVSEVMKRTA